MGLVILCLYKCKKLYELNINHCILIIQVFVVILQQAVANAVSSPRVSCILAGSTDQKRLDL
jgi:hypothetical protein